jgi:hypothetical protein
MTKITLADTFETWVNRFNENDSDQDVIINDVNSLVGDISSLEADISSLESQINNAFAAGGKYADNIKLNFGDDSDLQIYHDGSNSYVVDDGTGYLRLWSNGLGVQIGSTTGEVMINALVNNRVDLYYDNTVALTTTSTGVTIPDNLLVQDQLNIQNSRITDSSGSLILSADPSNGSAASEILLNIDGTTRLTLDGSGHITLPDATTGTFLVGGTNDVARYINFSGSKAIFGYNGTNAVVEAGAGLHVKVNGDSDAMLINSSRETTFYGPVAVTNKQVTWTGSVTLDPANGNVQDILLTGTVTNVAAALDSGESVLINIDNQSTYSITWSGDFVWGSGDGIAPTLQDAADTIISVWNSNGTIFASALNGA